MCESIVIPKKLKLCTCSIGILFISNLKDGIEFLLRCEKWKSMYFVFKTLIDNLLIVNQSKILDSSELIRSDGVSNDRSVLFSTEKVQTGASNEVSSAYRT